MWFVNLNPWGWSSIHPSIHPSCPTRIAKPDIFVQMYQYGLCWLWIEYTVYTVYKSLRLWKVPFKHETKCACVHGYIEWYGIKVDAGTKFLIENE